MKQSFYDPYTMVAKDIPELIAELNKLVMGKLPGTPAVATVWGVLCEAARRYSFAKSIIDSGDASRPQFYLWTHHGEIATATAIIHKIADGMGVDSFKLREVPLERPSVPGDQPERHPDPGEQDQPG